jgi:hypothetical protein
VAPVFRGGFVGALIVRRDKGWSDKFRKWKVVLDGNEVGRLREGEEIRVDVPDGAHEIQMKIDWTTSAKIPFECGSDEEVRFICRPTAKPWNVIRYVTTDRADYITLEPDTT